MSLLKTRKDNKVNTQGKDVISHIDNIPVMLLRLLGNPSTNDRFLVFDAKHNDRKVLYIIKSADMTDSGLDKVGQAHATYKGYLSVQETFVLPSVLKELFNQHVQKLPTNVGKTDENQWTMQFNEMLEIGVRRQSSDLHIVVKPGMTYVQARVHGDLINIKDFSFEDASRMASSIYNQMASATSKDQSFSTDQVHETAINKTILGEPYQLRWISRPIHPPGSFTVVIRLLPLSTNDGDIKSFEELGFNPIQTQALDKALATPSGLIVIAGKVGGGKSTTSQTLITKILKASQYTLRAYTLESPVEYVIPGAIQIETKREHSDSDETATRKLTNTLNDFLRMDPNVLLLGEIRGRHVATVAKEMVETGHLVSTTVHAQSVIKIPSRLLGLGIELGVLAERGFLSIMVYQTLAKVPCAHCYFDLRSHSQQKGDTLENALTAMIERYCLHLSLLENVRIINSEGCGKCTNGIVSRTIVAEVAEPTLGMLNALRVGDYNGYYEAWRKDGGFTIKEHALTKIFRGEICPIGYQRQVESLTATNLYEDIDQHYYKSVLQHKDFGLC